jgi:putative tricarboxylic transport membrane protein
VDSFLALMDGFGTALQPEYLVFALIGVFVGTAVGVLPGIGPAMTVALLLPLTFSLDPTAAFILFAGIYYGGMYGGSTTSILLNTPGESASIITALEGNRMAKKGRGTAALARATRWRSADAAPQRSRPRRSGPSSPARWPRWR